ncbi:restriction endonuclease subunit S [Olsenella phocaeensis]|uniref:restriction endonuclease subunit S n=1 Tax=Olsenella phocaeensis TaxID=1852385 RepID=UPI000930A717|nr:restriction endonuclease subunit S [Olsenella phocaeensis]
MGSNTVQLGDVVLLEDSKREPLSSRQRASRKGSYPYYGAQGVVDHLNDFTYKGTYLLVAEDGENLRSRKQPIAHVVSGEFRVNNHAHVLRGTNKCDIRILAWLLNEMNISSYVTGAAQPKLNQKNLQSIELELPTTESQRAILRLLNPINKKYGLISTQMIICSNVATRYSLRCLDLLQTMLYFPI